MMSFHEVVVFMLTILGVFIQVEFQSKSLSLLETHYWIMSIVFVALLVFAAAWLKSTAQVQATYNVNHTGAMSEISLVSGILALALLFLIIHAVIGIVILIFLALYVTKIIYSYKPVNDGLFLLLDKLKRAIYGQLAEDNEESPPQVVGGSYGCSQNP